MELDNLITNIKPTSSDSPKYLAIEIGPETVKAAVWEIAGHKPQVLQTGTVEDLKSDSNEDLLKAVDTAVTKAQQGITPEPKEVVFSLPESWIKSGTIDKPKKTLLKTLTQKLDLKPLGFVVTTEALVHYLKTKHGTPPSTILLGLSETDVLVTIVTAGEVTGTQSVGRSDDLGADVEEGIARFGQLESLPTAMVLYDGHTDLESEKQVLISYNWQERLPFLHIPKIENLSSDETVKAVAIAGGMEVINAQKQASKESSSKPQPQASAASPAVIPDLSQEFGFSSHHKGIDKKPEKTPEKTTEPTASHPPVSKSQSGDNFVVNDANAPSTDDHPKAAEHEAGTAPKKFPSRFSIFKKLISKFPSKASSPTFGSKRSKLTLAIIIGSVAVFALLISLGVAYWRIPKASVAIFFDPKIIDTNLTFTLDPNIKEFDIQTSTLPAVKIEAEVTGSKEAQVTGEKLVGDQATGTVTIFNRTDSSKTFASGTKLNGPDSLVFTIDQEVTLASASSEESSDFSVTTKPAQADVAITASNIGAQFNLGTGTELSVANFDTSSYVAQAKGDITGGTSRQITAVSQEDLEALEEALLEELRQKVLEQADLTGVGNSISAITVPDQEEQIELEFSAQESDEASTLSLSATLITDTLTYKKSDFDLLIEMNIKDSLADNFQLSQTQSEIEIIEATLNKDGSVDVKAKVMAKVTPTLNPEDIARNIKGRYPEVTRSYFQSLPNFSRVEIDITPALPARLKTFPRLSENIEVSFEADNKEE